VAGKPLSTSDWAVLAFLAEGEAHGFRLASVFGPEGELGQIWKIQRPQVYRTLEYLVAEGLIRPTRQEEGDAGPPRTVYEVTQDGRQTVKEWLQTPVAHLREGRSDLLLKLAFLERSGADHQPLLKAQKKVFTEILEKLEARLEKATGVDRMVLLWRVENARSVLHFLGQLR
jgi:DNA-binding PadR family transcriptional regulator